MADTLPTVWPITPHTKAKHAILERYLQAWMPILSRQAATLAALHGDLRSRRALFIDGFAGPGIYEGGEPGSPVIAARAAIDHSQSFPCPIEMLFVEHRPDRHERLVKELKPEIERAGGRQDVVILSPEHGECDPFLRKLIDEHDRHGLKFGPALAFLDQFGYGSVSMDLVSRILRFPECEVFSYLDYYDMNRFITDPHKAPAFDRAFGGNEWRECIPLPELQRRECLLSRYKEALRERARAQYVTSFLMFDRDNSPLYWLVFCTNHIRGLEEMKKAMWSVDGTGGFKFSDRDEPSQLQLLKDAFDDQWLARELCARLAGRTLSVSAVKEFVLVETPCYLHKPALRKLEADGDVDIMSAPSGRRPRQYPDGMADQIMLRFRKSLF